MKLEKRDRIIEILKFHGEMIGNDSEEAKQLIREMRQLNVSGANDKIEDKIKNDMIILCEMIGYTPDESTNKCRKDDIVAKRDAICRVICDKYHEYTRASSVAAMFFGKDRTTGNHIEKRTKNLLESKDKLFMFNYNNLLAEYIKQAA